MNSYTFKNDVCEIETSSKKLGKVVFTIDREDFNRIKAFKWSPVINNGNIYAVTSLRYYSDSKIISSQIQLHRLITSYEFPIVDHADNNSLNNRKSNLRNATHSQNDMNKKRAVVNPNGFKGVYYRKDTLKYRATIKLNKKRINIGHYDSILEAARAYNKAAKDLFGEFALLNAV